MKVLIIEDEAPAFRRLQKLLEEIDSQIEIIDVFDGVQETVKYLQSHKAPDLIFMDIQLSDGISFEIFDQVEVKKPVIFTTAFDEYTLRAFKVNSIDYLLKPINQEDLIQSINKYKSLHVYDSPSESNLSKIIKEIHLTDVKYKSRFLVKIGEKMLSVETKDIGSFHAKNGLVYLQTKQNKFYVIDHTLDEIIESLDPEKFFRANRQFIICYDCVTIVHKYGKGKLLVETSPIQEEQIIVSSERASVFKRWLG
ncbi:LytR/AlgR family response regulator transcription factor [Reichenbachiella versicolor]|uniref:LytR/AlgR family response regulator transcription factor n=1 Tax=Reichenbachiella versicolor TaxID=1821036 RepID=UPI000D6DCB57|nr:LytTR family DNA-binding domain-containing protein [Reichenbachiella versicolor]